MTLIKNVGWLTLAFIVGKGASFIWNLALARYFNNAPELYGQYAVLLSQYLLWSIVAEGNIEYALIQRISTKELSIEKSWKLGLQLRFISGLFSSACFFLLIKSFYDSYQIIAGAGWFAASLIILAVGRLPVAIWAGQNNMKPQAFVSIISTFVLVGSSFYALSIGGNITTLAFCNFLSVIVNALILWTKAISENKTSAIIKVNVQRTDVNSILSIAMPLLLSSFVFLVLYRIDIIMLSKIRNDIEAGIMNAALMLFFAFTDLTWSQLGAAIIPIMGAKWKIADDQQSLIMHLKRGLVLFGVFAVISLNIFNLFGGYILAVLFGEKSIWIDTFVPLFILLTGYWATVLYAILYRILLLEGGAKTYAMISAFALVIKFAISVPLIFFFGYMGAAVSIVLTQIIITWALWYRMSAVVKKIMLNFSDTVKIMVLTIITTLIMIFKVTDVMNIYINSLLSSLVMAVCIYFAAYNSQLVSLCEIAGLKIGTKSSIFNKVV